MSRRSRVVEQLAAEDLRRKTRAYEALCEAASALSYREYLNYVRIDSDPVAAFKEKAEPWQWDAAYMIRGPLEKVAGIDPGYSGPMFVWRTMPRGHDKTSSTARSLAWVLAFAKKKLTCYHAAADRDQANLLAEFMKNEADLNPWLSKRLEFKRNVIVGKTNGSVLHILAADAAGSFGQKPDITVCDELTHWADWEVWNVLLSGRDKRPNSAMFVITNAGLMGSWQWDAREQARRAAEAGRLWKFFEAPGPIATWMDPERVKDARDGLPQMECRRVYDNQWLDPAEDSGFVTRAQALKCESPSLSYQTKGQDGRDYYAAIDYGPKKDRTVVIVGHRTGDEFVVDRMDVMEGREFPNKLVPISKVEDLMEQINTTFPGVQFVIDPYQMEGSIQKYPFMRIERFEPRAGKANYEMAQALRYAVVNGRLSWYPGCGDVTVNERGTFRKNTLVDEFASVIVKPTASGFRIDTIGKNHDDRVVALGMAVWRALSVERRRRFSMCDNYF